MIIDRYIVREILYTLLAVLAVLLIIFISNRFIRYLAEVSGGAIDASVLFTIVGLKTLSALVIILPLGLFMAVLLAFSRLYKDSEMTALNACGVTMARIYRPVLLFAAAVAIVVALISFRAAPWAEERSYQIRDAQQARTALSGAAPGRFTQFSGAKGVFYFQRFAADGETMTGVFARQQRDEGDIVLVADRGYARTGADGQQYLVFEHGHRYEGTPGAADFRIIEFREHTVRLEQREVRASSRKQRAADVSCWPRTRAVDAAELQWRISMPLSGAGAGPACGAAQPYQSAPGKYAKLRRRARLPLLQQYDGHGEYLDRAWRAPASVSGGASTDAGRCGCCWPVGTACRGRYRACG